MNSIGSSMVRMWYECFPLMRSITAASVEDLPDPVGPVTSTTPLRSPAMCSSSPGRWRSAKLGTWLGITRITIAHVPRCIKTLTRNRVVPPRL